MIELTPEGTIENLLYKPDLASWEQRQAMNSHINFEGVKDFKFLSFSGFGEPTRNSAVYYEDLENLYEINFMRPQFTTADGDGTVLLTAALADGMPERFVEDRVLVQCSHTDILYSKAVFNNLMKFL